jgi:hypothetical protein
LSNYAEIEASINDGAMTVYSVTFGPMSVGGLRHF